MTLGLFSVIDALFDTPMADLLPELPLAPDMCEALVEHKGPKGGLLECLNALEHGDFENAEGILPTAGRLYSSALAWAEEVTESTLRPGRWQRGGCGLLSTSTPRVAAVVSACATGRTGPGGPARDRAAPATPPC
ncbi:MAG: hypothetical protein ACLP0J_19145 [Solirubrobacteraceae bacterium]